MPKPYISEREYTRRASILKKFGLVNYDLREKLNNAQKAQITKLTRKHEITLTDKNGNTKSINSPPLRALIENPELFKTRKVNKKQAEKWKKSGYKVINGRVVVRGEKGATIKINATSIELSRKHIKEKTRIYDNVSNFLKAAKKAKLKKGEYFMFSVGRYGIFHRRFMDEESLENYVNDLLERLGIEEGDEIQLQLIVGKITGKKK